MKGGCSPRWATTAVGSRPTSRQGPAEIWLARDGAELPTGFRAYLLAAADAGRAAIPLLGNDLAIAEELLGPSARSGSGAPSIALDGVTVFLSLDRKGHCTGIYAVGDKPAEREIRSSTWPATRLLSQAVGRASTLQPPSGGQTTTRSFAGRAPVVVRWLAGAPIELRIGDAKP